MRIALLSEKYTPDIGGLAISAGRLGHLLTSAGHEVQVFAPTSSLPARELRTLTHEGVGVTRVGAHNRTDDTLVDWFEIVVEEHKHQPFDVLHAYFLPQAGFVATYAGKYLNVPSVVSIRGNDIERAAFDPSRFSHVMYALQNSSAVTTNTPELVKKAQAFVDREVILIPNGIDINHFKLRSRNENLAEAFGLKVGTKELNGQIPVIGFVGELREKKGLRTLLNGYAQLNKHRPAALLIIGEVRAGDDRQTFDELHSTIPDPRIIVTGYIAHQELPSYYSLMDVFVHPSLRDGLPNALLEAMACERAVVATPVGGMRDVLVHGKNGLFVDVNDPSGLAEILNNLLENTEERDKLGKAARDTVVNRFTLEKELEANLGVYKSLGLPV
jgi:glycosyltransferase involved in cell wall biosynthesis